MKCPTGAVEKEKGKNATRTVAPVKKNRGVKRHILRIKGLTGEKNEKILLIWKDHHQECIRKIIGRATDPIGPMKDRHNHAIVEKGQTKYVTRRNVQEINVVMARQQATEEMYQAEIMKEDHTKKD